MPRLLPALIVIAAVLAGAAFWLSREDAPITVAIDLAERLNADVAGYDQALTPRAFTFPADHGPHPGYKIEWWYYTGNLVDAGGRRFGYQFTIFRSALTPPSPQDSARTSAWATNQLYSAQFAISDLEGEDFYSFEQASRGAAGLAGAQGDPFRVWVEGWQVAAADEPQGEPPAMRIQAQQGEVALDLVLRPEKPLVIQGDGGLSKKSTTEGVASYYYSITRLATTGTLSFDGESHDVTGWSWMDREWSSTLLDKNQQGWNWFSIQLDDGRDIAFAWLRPTDNVTKPFGYGAVYDAAGTKDDFTLEGMVATPTEMWSSPRSGGRYPVRWQINLPDPGLELTIDAAMPDQELDVGVPYWEGAILVQGTADGQPITGRGYLEMTGYGEGSTP